MMKEGGGEGERESSVPVTTSTSPEFEFWKVRNPSFPQTQLLSADELFVDGVLLPLHLVHSHIQSKSEPNEPNDDLTESTPPPVPAPADFSAGSALVTSSKRWKGIFRGAGGEKKTAMVGDEKLRRRKWRNGGGGAAELNINIWPFSRSRSAGEKSVRMGFPMKASVAGRKVSSAPCSRSNSRGESSKVAGGLKSPATVSARGGVHVGRTNPIWKIRKCCKKTQTPPHTAIGEKESKEPGDVENGADGGGKKVNAISGARIEILNLTVKTRIRKMRRQMKSTRCGGEDKALLTDGEQINNGGGVISSHFNLKAFFSKKVY